MIRALVTRPAEDAAPLIVALKSRGIEALAEPLLTIRFKDGVALDLAGVQALLFTSANGARAFARLSDRRDLPALAVGDGTAETLRALGFVSVDSASGDVEDLEALASRRLDPAKGRLLHVAGTTVAGDLAGRLRTVGYQVERMALYDAEAAATLSEPTRKALEAGTIDWVVVFSPRTAGAFASLVGRAGLADRLRKATLVALSEAVAEAAALSFGRIAVAARPTQAALLETVDGLIREQRMTEPATPQPVPPKSSETLGPAPRTPFLPVALAAVLALIAGAALYATWPRWETPSVPATAPATTAVPVPAASPAARVDLTPLGGTVDRLEAAIAALGQRVDAVAEEAKKAAERPVTASTVPPATAPAAPLATAPTVDLGPIEARLARIEQSLAELAPRMGAVGEIERRVASLPDIEKRVARLADIEKRLAALADIERRLGELERAGKAERRHDVEALAALRLGDALASGRPYRPELALLQGNSALEAEVKSLSARADTGVPTRAQLIDRFPGASAAAAKARTASANQDDLWERTLARLQGLITVRRIDAGTGDDGRLAAAETALRRGDLAAAIAGVDALPDGPVKSALSGWRTDAAARLEADAAFARLTQALAAGLGKPG
jgi:uroporphyrinogen-III synthase